MELPPSILPEGGGQYFKEKGRSVRRREGMKESLTKERHKETVGDLAESKSSGKSRSCQPREGSQEELDLVLEFTQGPRRVAWHPNYHNQSRRSFGNSGHSKVGKLSKNNLKW